MTDWQPIETAPTDDIVLVANPDHGRLPVVAWKVEDVWYEHDVFGSRLRPQPTLWCRWPTMPRPNGEGQKVTGETK